MQAKDNPKDLNPALLAAVTDFAYNGGSKVAQLLSNLEAFAKPKRQKHSVVQSASSYIEGNIDIVESPNEYPASVNEQLCASLAEHLKCSCTRSPEGRMAKEHLARLSLRPITKNSKDDVLFDILCSSSPGGGLGNAVKWQQLRFEVPR